MKRYFLPLVLVLAALAAGCASAPAASAPKQAALPAAVASAAAKDSPITMANLDDYIGRPGVIVVDLRNFDERLNSGYIIGTEVLPFLQYLEGRMASRGTVDGKPTWDAASAQINENFAFANYFPTGSTVILFCASGTRAAFVKTILDKKGYTTFNAGGFKDYKGAHKVLGDGSFTLTAAK